MILPNRVKDPTYLGWIRQQPCMVKDPYCFGDVVPHHVEARGISTKCDDTKTVPLCAYKHHLDIHNKGRKWFAQMYGMDLKEKVREYREKYERKTNV